MGVAEIRRLKQLEDENTKLKRSVADLTLDNTMCRMRFEKVVKPARRREVFQDFQQAYSVSERRSCNASWLRRASHRYKSRRDTRTALRMRMKVVAETRVCYRYRKLRRLEGWAANQKRM